MKKRSILFSLLFPFAALLFASPLSNEDEARSYIEEHLDLARNHAQAKGIPISICLAMALVESNAGNSMLATQAYNHFGIKADSLRWKGETFSSIDDDKDVQGRSKPSSFRKYGSVAASYEDYANFLSGNRRYAHLFRIPAADYAGWALGLKVAGYASAVSYADNIIEMIERFELYRFDEAAKIQPIAVEHKQHAPLLICAYAKNKADAKKKTERNTAAKDESVLIYPMKTDAETPAYDLQGREVLTPVHPQATDLQAIAPPAVAPAVPSPTQCLAPMKAKTTVQPVQLRN